MTSVREYQSQPQMRSMSDPPDLVGRHKDGHEIPVEVSLSPLQSSGGMRVIAAVRDVTERRRAADALAASEARFRRSFQDSGVGMALVIPDGGTGQLLEMNDALASLIGYPLEEYRAQGALSIVHPDDLPALSAQIAAINSGRVDVVGPRPACSTRRERCCGRRSRCRSCATAPVSRSTSSCRFSIRPSASASSTSSSTSPTTTR